MEVKYYLRVIQRGWWLLLLTIIIAVNASLIVSYLLPPQYQSNSRYVISPNATLYDDTWDVVSSLDTLDRRSIINTYKEVLASSSASSNIDSFTGMTDEQIEEYEIVVTVVPDSNVVNLAITGPSPQMVVDISTEISENAIQYINELYPVYSFNILDAPSIPTEPYSPKPLQNAGLAFVAGAIIGLGLVLVRDQLQNTLESVRMRSIVDGVSTAYTRDYLERRLIEEITQKPEESIALGIINFRGLEEVIDVIPQAFANRAIQELTQTLKEELRGRDLVGRWDKTKLAVMLPSTNGAAAKNTFVRLQRILGTTIQIVDADDLDIDPDPCVGIAAGYSEIDYDDFVSLADDAEAKASALQGETIILLENES